MLCYFGPESIKLKFYLFRFRTSGSLSLILHFVLGDGHSVPLLAPWFRFSFSFYNFSDQVSSVYNIRGLSRMRPVFDFDTARTTGTYFVHNRLDYCNSV